MQKVPIQGLYRVRDLPGIIYDIFLDSKTVASVTDFWASVMDICHKCYILSYEIT